MLSRVGFCLLLCCLPAFAKSDRTLQHGKVMSQDLSSQDGGVMAIPMGTGVMTVPITRRSNIVVIDTATQRLTWLEHGNKAIVLPVNGTIEFYQEGGWYVVLDSRQKNTSSRLSTLKR